MSSDQPGTVAPTSSTAVVRAVSFPVRWLLRSTRWECAVLAVVAAIVVYQVFCEPIVGTADNRDWWRVMDQVGLGYRDSPDPTFFKNLQRDYVRVPAKDIKYLTPQTGLVKVALAVNSVVSKDGLFDITVMGLVNSAAFLAALAVFLAAFRKRKAWIRICVGLAVIMTLSDVRIVAYFNSFYCESSQLIFLLATVGFALLTADESNTRRTRYACFGGFLVAMVLFLFSKTQDLVFSLPLAVVAFRILPSDAKRWRERGAIAAAVVALFVWGMKSDAYAVTHRVNIDVTLDEEILKHSKNPTRDMQELGDGDRANVTFGRITMFYGHHPLRWWSMAQRRMKEAFTRTPYGNFELPLTGESHAFDGFSEWKNRHYPRSLWFWISATLIYFGVLAMKWRWGDRQARTLALIQAMWVVGCILQFIAVVTFEANGTEKHLFIFNVLVDLVLIMAIGEIDALVALWRTRYRRTAPAPP